MSDEKLIDVPGVFGETGNFLLERELGRGGMGGVYMGRDKMLDRPVAVKVMLREYGSDAEFIEKFKREAQAAARLIHPNIAQIYSYGIADGMPYIAMELVAGGSLDQLMKTQGGNIDIPRVMKICEQVAQALRCAADQGLVHGDVKPENVLLDANGNAKLVDFGLAAMQKNTDEIWGTPYYIAPEKVKKEAVDYRADMYSLGGTVYHALTGVAPFEGEDATAVVRKRLEGNPVPPSVHRPAITPQIDALVMKMLAMNPADRFPSFEALLEEFRRVLTSGLTASAATAGTVTGKTGRRLVVKGGKRFKTSATSVRVPPGDNAEQPDVKDDFDDDDYESGNVGAKVAMVILYTALGIGAVAALLAWGVTAHKKSEREAEMQLVTGKIAEAKKAIAGIRENALKFADNVDASSGKSVAECQKTTDKLMRVLEGKFDAGMIAMIKPPPSKELVDAIALTNKVDLSTVSNALETAAVAVAGQMAAVVGEMAKQMGEAVKAAMPAMNIPKFRDPEEDEADPMSPAHAEYLKEKEKWEKEQAEKLKREAEAKAAAAATAAPAQENKPKAAGDRAAENEILAMVIRDMSDLWSRAYACQAAAIRIRHEVTQVVEKIDAAKFDETDAKVALEALAAFSVAVKDDFDKIKASDDYTKIQKGTSYIRSKGDNTITRAVNNLLIAQRERERAEAAAAAAAAEAERIRRLAEEKASTIKNDNAAITEKFDSLLRAGVFRQLDWKGAIRQLKVLRDDFKFAESQVFGDTIIEKVEMMQTVQDVFIANCKDYTFTKSKLRGCKVVEINVKEIKLLKPNGKSHAKLNWVRFYGQFRVNLNELIIKFIEKGKMVSKLPDGKRLSPQRWADAMMGAALTIQLICSDEPTAAARSVGIAKEAVKQFPDYLKRAQDIFPDIDFSESTEN